MTGAQGPMGRTGPGAQPGDMIGSSTGRIATMYSTNVDTLGITSTTANFGTLTVTGTSSLGALNVTGLTTLTGGIQTNSIDSIGTSLVIGPTNAKTITMGNVTGTTAVNVVAGTGGVTITSTGTGNVNINNTGSSSTVIGNTAGTLTLVGVSSSSLDSTGTLNIGGGATAINIGNIAGASLVTIKACTGKSLSAGATPGSTKEHSSGASKEPPGPTQGRSSVPTKESAGSK
jgi:hypothetical protein